MLNLEYMANDITRIEACVPEIKACMATNKLMLNRDKTVIIVFSAPRHSVFCDIHHIPIDALAIVIYRYFYEKLSLVSHIKHICKKSLFHLKNGPSIRSFHMRVVLTELLQSIASWTAFVFYQTYPVLTEYCSRHPNEDVYM